LFDREYAAGEWDHLADVAEAPRYGVIAAYCRHFALGGRLLDVGCGVGVLLRHVGADAHGGYVGVDVSAQAVAAAEAAAPGWGTFHVADAAGYRPEGRFQAVIFNEVLIYVEAPGEVVAQYGRTLAPGGVLIVSQWDGMGRSKGAQLWRLVMGGHDVLAEAQVVAGGDRSWTIRVLRPSPR
jgi:2-polyprenyl-3-methyl-5-hydroxy-6-metoxy-1,4-benzoquinol methylase